MLHFRCVNSTQRHRPGSHAGTAAGFGPSTGNKFQIPAALCLSKEINHAGCWTRQGLSAGGWRTAGPCLEGHHHPAICPMRTKTLHSLLPSLLPHGQPLQSARSGQLGAPGDPKPLCFLVWATGQGRVRGWPRAGLWSCTQLPVPTGCSCVPPHPNKVPQEHSPAQGCLTLGEDTTFGRGLFWVLCKHKIFTLFRMLPKGEKM